MTDERLRFLERAWQAAPYEREALWAYCERHGLAHCASGLHDIRENVDGSIRWREPKALQRRMGNTGAILFCETCLRWIPVSGPWWSISELPGVSHFRTGPRFESTPHTPDEAERFAYMQLMRAAARPLTPLERHRQDQDVARWKAEEHARRAKWRKDTP